MSRDENDLAQQQGLPKDPTDDAVQVGTETPRVLTVQDIIRSAREEAFAPAARGFSTTGIYQLDEITGGLKPGFVWVFGADTSWGKSSFLVMVADENIRKKRKVLIVSAEDSEKIYGMRLLQRRTKVNADRLRKKRLTQEERQLILECEKSAEDVPVFLDARSMSVEAIAKKTREMILEYGIDVVAFDYLQALDNEKPQQDRRNQVTYIARTLTNVVKQLDREGKPVAGIIFSQLTVDGKKEKPDKHSIRESRDVSNAAEVVMLGFTPSVAIMNKDKNRVLVEADKKCVFVDKCKDGPRGGLVQMDWNTEAACFETIEDPENARFTALGGREFQDFGDNLGGGDDPW